MAKIDELTDTIKNLNALIHQYQQQLAKEGDVCGVFLPTKKTESLEEKIIPISLIEYTWYYYCYYSIDS